MSSMRKRCCGRLPHGSRPIRTCSRCRRYSAIGWIHPRVTACRRSSRLTRLLRSSGTWSARSCRGTRQGGHRTCWHESSFRLRLRSDRGSRDHPLEEHMMRSHLLRIILATLALVVGVVQADAQSPTKVKIRLDWKGGAQHAPFYLGKEKGYYRDEGLDLDVISGSGSSDTIKQIGSKAVEFGLVDALVLVQGAQQRVPAKSIAAYYQTTPIVLISPQAKPVTNPRQLLDGIKLGSK